MKFCSRCSKSKAEKSFNRNATKIDGLQNWCRECHNEQASDRTARWRKDHPEQASVSARRRNLKASYGLTIDQFDAMALRQGGACAICLAVPSGSRKQERILHVDHDHKTRKIRGLLCSRCNRALGLMGDDLVRITNAAEYIRAAL